MSAMLLYGATIVTVDRERRIIDDGAVLIDGGLISVVGDSEALLSVTDRSVRRIDCRGKLVIPGLVDAHGHAGHSLIKTLGCDSPTFWMRTVTPAYFHATTPEYWYHDGLVSALERVRAGVTCGVSVMGSRPAVTIPRSRWLTRAPTERSEYATWCVSGRRVCRCPIRSRTGPAEFPGDARSDSTRCCPARNR